MRRRAGPRHRGLARGEIPGVPSRRHRRRARAGERQARQAAPARESRHAGPPTPRSGARPLAGRRARLAETRTGAPARNHAPASGIASRAPARNHPGKRDRKPSASTDFAPAGAPPIPDSRCDENGQGGVVRQRKRRGQGRRQQAQVDPRQPHAVDRTEGAAKVRGVEHRLADRRRELADGQRPRRQQQRRPPLQHHPHRRRACRARPGRVRFAGRPGGGRLDRRRRRRAVVRPRAGRPVAPRDGRAARRGRPGRRVPRRRLQGAVEGAAAVPRKPVRGGVPRRRVPLRPQATA